MFKPAVYTSENQKKLQWLNFCNQSHDLICGCDEPTKHLLKTILEKSNWLDITEDKKTTIKQCLGLEEDHTATEDKPGEEDEGFGPGDLETLFAEDNEPDFTER